MFRELVMTKTKQKKRQHLIVYQAINMQAAVLDNKFTLCLENVQHNL